LADVDQKRDLGIVNYFAGRAALDAKKKNHQPGEGKAAEKHDPGASSPTKLDGVAPIDLPHDSDERYCACGNKSGGKPFIVKRAQTRDLIDDAFGG
jgi:hypothetical protein